MRVRSRTDIASKSKQYIVRRPIEWMAEQASLVRDFIVLNALQGQPAMLQEGGLPAEGVLQQFDESVWKDFGDSFATLHITKDTEPKENRS